MARLLSMAAMILMLAYVAHSARQNVPLVNEPVTGEAELPIVTVVTQPPAKEEEDIPIRTPRDDDWKNGQSIFAPGPEMDLDEKCIKTLTDKCASQLSLAFMNVGLVNDFDCCWKMIRLGNVCWGSIIITFQDQCHALPAIMQRCKNITHYVDPPRSRPRKLIEPLQLKY